ncbi:MAG: NAD(P)/FAD-dependent oxidoreductase [Desulfobacteraceae bacterium]|nr:NAD(P)/FAD-dependent oxidoreductase [Desulfobacteraceae bacterium]
MKDSYDIVVVGSGLGGLTAANRLAVSGHSVFLAEQHRQLGGLATFFRRKHHLFDVALHGFPIGMKKSLRKYWGKEFSDRIVQVKKIVFDNPQFHLVTTFDALDFTRILIDHFGVETKTVEAFFATLKAMNYYDDQSETIRELFERFFPAKHDVWRLLMEPITYANGSTLDEPAISYGIVFGNFMSKGVYTFLGGTDKMLSMMAHAMRLNGVDCQTCCLVEKILVDKGKVKGAIINGKEIACRAVVSNGNLLNTVHDLVGDEHFTSEFMSGFANVRLSNSSCQVYMGIRPGEKLDDIGDLLFTSTHPVFDSTAICSPQVSSRTYSVYYPAIRPGSDKYTIVASMNARYEDWAKYDDNEYEAKKKWLIEDTLDALEKYVPNIRQITDFLEAATPRTFQRYTLHRGGSSFGTKFAGLQYSMALNEQVGGLFHTGSVGIIMSGWLGAANYGVIIANQTDKYLVKA